MGPLSLSLSQLLVNNTYRRNLIACIHLHPCRSLLLLILMKILSALLEQQQNGILSEIHEEKKRIMEGSYYSFNRS